MSPVADLRRKLHTAAAVAMGAVVRAGCAPSPGGASGSGSSGALAQNAGVAVDRSVNPNGLVPGSANPSAAMATAPINVDPEFAQVANVLATGVAAWESGGTSLVGWALSEILTAAGPSGTGTPDQDLSAALNGLSGQIVDINTQLTQIEAQLSKVTNQIKDSTYQIEIQNLATNHVAPLLSMWQDYSEIVSSQDTNRAVIDQLSSAVLNSATGASSHIESITQAYLGSATTEESPLPGMFSTFVVNQGVPAMDDRPLYKDYIVPYGQYFASLMVMGLALQVEAYHQQGDAAAAQQAVNTVWSDVYRVLQATGSPVSNDVAQLNIATGNLWTISPLCIVSQFNSGDADSWWGNTDNAQAALAITTTGEGLTFESGARVCSIDWRAYQVSPSDWVPEVVKGAGLPSEIASGSTDPTTLWRDPSAADIAKLYADRGSATPQQYLNSIGFAIPSPDGLYGTTALAHDFWYGGNSGWVDLASGADTCLFFASCENDDNPPLGFLVIAMPQCFLGTGDYKGLPTACGTDWLASIWTQTPPPPSSTSPASSISSSAVATSSRAVISGAPVPSASPSASPDRSGETSSVTSSS